MPFPNDPKLLDSLLCKAEAAQRAADAEQVPVDLRRKRENDLSSNFYLIFSVQEVVEFKQDTQRLIRRLSSLCLLVTSCVAALVGLWLVDVVFRQ